MQIKERVIRVDPDGFEEVGRELTELQLHEIESRVSLRATHYRKWQRYLKGCNPTITDAPDKPAPDNRVPVPFARKIVRTLKGYMFKPGYITYSTEGDYINTLKDLFDINDEELLTAEIAKDVLSAPESYEIARVGESINDIRLYHVPYNKGYPVYDDTLARNLVAFVHFETIDDGSTELAYTRTTYYADRYETHTRAGEGAQWDLEETREHPFGRVPVSIFKAGDESLPVFSSILPMVDEHDKVISSAYADERERFANSLLLLLDKLVTGDEAERAETLKQLRENRIIQDLGRNGEVQNVANAVAFLTKPSRGADTAEEADRLERLIYDMAMVINPTDDSFSAASGIALRYKLLPMEFLAADIEAYFSRGLQNRIELIGNALMTLNNVQPEPVTIHWRRNLPTDLENLAQTAQMLKGTLSDQTILQQFPGDVVPEIEAEMKRLEQQSDPYRDSFDEEDDEA